MKKLTFITLLFSSFSCANMFNGAVLPNQCKKCEVINKATNEVLSTFEGCGSENTRLEEQAKESAYDLSRNGNLCNLEVVCKSWKKEPEQETAAPVNGHR
ncbi:MAG: hypothetical protein AB7O47_04715 [Flavobacteriales bacterium]